MIARGSIAAAKVDAALTQINTWHADRLRQFEIAALTDAVADGATVDIDRVDAAVADCTAAWQDVRARLHAALASAARGDLGALERLSRASIGDVGDGAPWARLDA